MPAVHRQAMHSERAASDVSCRPAAPRGRICCHRCMQAAATAVILLGLIRMPGAGFASGDAARGVLLLPRRPSSCLKPLESSVALKAAIPDWMNPDVEWSPTDPVGPPPQYRKLPCTFEARTYLFVHKEPRLDSPLIPKRIVREGATFSVDRIVMAGRVRGVDVVFMKPKPAFFKKDHFPDDDEYVGEDGWIADTGILRGPWYLKRVVQRYRVLNVR
eukprot:TRINITY_DN37770_c0_g1_i1.p1 TRINITY_DN37770_c0_g1~~TRINITY_DN37770_c0_g1_i1.p1  ORF type:complete len:217 (+),score=23.15 TRINITY_DN37770_c0_g1_i1:84-734(+)